MRKRIPLHQRQLPNYSRGEEIMNMVTHIVGGSFGILALILCVVKSFLRQGAAEVIGSFVYGISLIWLYTMSSIYHGLLPSTGKKVLQVLDHCTIYALIAGTYTVISLGPLRRQFPELGWTVLAAQWILAGIAATLTAIDLKKYAVFSMICYIGMGWMVLLFLPQTITALTKPGFYLLLAGGIAYTIGAVLYGIGAKRKWIHSIFHIFVVLGSVLQFLCVFLYAL